MFLSHIVATTISGLIGINNNLPWGRVKGDLKFFKDLTHKHVVIMGVNTINSIPKNAQGMKLPDRFIVVDADLSRGVKNIQDSHSLTVGNLISENRYDVISEHLPRDYDVNQYFIAGGAKVYSRTIDKVNIVWRNVIHPNKGIVIKEGDQLHHYPLDVLERDFIRIKADFIADEDASILCELWLRKGFGCVL